MLVLLVFFFFNDTATTEIYTLSLHDALPILSVLGQRREKVQGGTQRVPADDHPAAGAPLAILAVPPEHVVADRSNLARSEEHTSELQSRQYLVCRLLLEKKKMMNCSLLTPIS